MFAIEELKSMTHEDLIRYAQELQESNEKLAKEKDEYWGYYSKTKEKFDNFKNAIKSVILIVD